MADTLNAQTIAARLRAARGMETRRDVCNAVGVSLSALGMYEIGKRIPSAPVMLRLAKHYRTTVQALFFDE